MRTNCISIDVKGVRADLFTCRVENVWNSLPVCCFH